MRYESLAVLAEEESSCKSEVFLLSFFSWPSRSSVVAAEDLTVVPPITENSAPAEMLHDYLLNKVGEATRRLAAPYESFRTPDYIKECQERIFCNRSKNCYRVRH